MRGLYLDDRLGYSEDLPRPVPSADEVLLRVRLAAICGTDLELLEGYHGFRGVPGHEFVADVVEGPGAWLGRRVVAEINVAAAADPRHAPDRTVLGVLGRDGAFAEFVTAPLANLHAVPDHVADEAAVFCEPLAAALRPLEQVRLSPAWRVAVLGPGRLGLLQALVLALDGRSVTVLGRRPESLATARRLRLEAALVGEQAEHSYDLVVDATGSPAGLAEAIRLTRPEGTLVVKSTFHGTAPVPTADLVVKELTLVGSRCGPFAPALRLLAAGALPVTALIEAEYPLAEGFAAFAHAARQGALKVLLRP